MFGNGISSWHRPASSFEPASDRWLPRFAEPAKAAGCAASMTARSSINRAALGRARVERTPWLRGSGRRRHARSSPDGKRCSRRGLTGPPSASSPCRDAVAHNRAAGVYEELLAKAEARDNAGVEALRYRCLLLLTLRPGGDAKRATAWYERARRAEPGRGEAQNGAGRTGHWSA